MSIIEESTLTAATTSLEDYEELVQSLQNIATEIIKYQDPSRQVSFHAKYDHLPRSKSDTDTTGEKKGLGKYYENLKIACNAAAKIVTVSNNNPSSSVDNQVSVVKCPSHKALHDRNKCVDLINKLTRDSIVSSVKREVLHAFILLGYRELQKLRHEPEEAIGIAMKLKHIIVACGQYYADYCNERQRRVRVDNKNLRLLDKLKVLKNHLGAVNYLRDEVEHLKCKNEELIKSLNKATKNEELRKSHKKATKNRSGGASKNCVRKSSSTACYTYTELGGRYGRKTDSKIQNRRENFSLESHLSVIRNLIEEQENMMSGLLEITKDLNQSEVIL